MDFRLVMEFKAQTSNVVNILHLFHLDAFFYEYNYNFEFKLNLVGLLKHKVHNMKIFI